MAKILDNVVTYDVLTMERDGAVYTYHRDSLGSVTEIADAQGALVERYEYDVYGAARLFDSSGQRIFDSAIGNPIRFTGRWYDAESDNYDYRARVYSPALGRFLQTDPLGAVDGFNLYAYVGNNPVTWLDPFGLWHAGVIADSYNAQVSIAMAGLNDLTANSTNPITHLLSATLQTAMIIGGAPVSLLNFDTGLGEWFSDPTDYNKIPVLGPVGQNFGTSLGELIMDPSVENGAQFTMAGCQVLTTVAGGLQLAEMIPGMKTIPVSPAGLPDNLASTFMGNKYTARVLSQDLILYRAGTKNQPLGQFFTETPPVSEIQVRIDQAVLPIWPGGGTSPIDTGFKVSIPKGTTIYEGIIAPQGGFYLGGTKQIVVQKPWTIKDVTVLDSFPLVK